MNVVPRNKKVLKAKQVIKFTIMMFDFVQCSKTC